MSNLKNKSELNFDAAVLLDNNSFYSSVTHCAYYSCYQLMKHIWLNSMGKTDAELSILTKNTTEGSHEVLINQIVIHIKNKSQDFRTFNNEIVSLKKLRHKSDYDNIQIDSTFSSNSIRLSQSSLNILKRCL